LGRELSRIEGQAAHIKTRFNVLKAKFQLPARAALASARTIELGRGIETAKSQLTAVTIQRQQRRNKTAAAARSIGLPPEAVQGDPTAIERLSKLLQDDSGESGPEYINYLIKRLTEFRQAGQKSFGQSFGGKITERTTASLAQSQLKCDLHAPEKFETVSQYLQEKIDATILGKRNTAKGIANYHYFKQEAEK
jgi:hypothetical protein